MESMDDLEWDQMEDQVGFETVADDCEFTPKAIEEPLVESCYTIKRETPKGKLTKKKSMGSSKSKTSGKPTRRFRKLRKALSFSRSKSGSDLQDHEVEYPNPPKPKKLIMPAALPTKPAAEEEDKYPIPPNPTAAGSGRTVKRKQLDLLNVEIEEMEQKIKRQGSNCHSPPNVFSKKNPGFRKRMLLNILHHTSVPAKICISGSFSPFCFKAEANYTCRSFMCSTRLGLGVHGCGFPPLQMFEIVEAYVSPHELLIPPYYDPKTSQPSTPRQLSCHAGLGEVIDLDSPEPAAARGALGAGVFIDEAPRQKIYIIKIKWCFCPMEIHMI